MESFDKLDGLMRVKTLELAEKDARSVDQVIRDRVTEIEGYAPANEAILADLKGSRSFDRDGVLNTFITLLWKGVPVLEIHDIEMTPWSMDDCNYTSTFSRKWRRL